MVHPRVRAGERGGMSVPHDPERQRGVVTAEFAMALLAATVVAVVLMWAVLLLVIQLRCIDSAEEIARQVARGDDAMVAAARRDAPLGAQVSQQVEGAVVVIRVRVDARPLRGLLPSIPVHAEARALKEPGE